MEIRTNNDLRLAYKRDTGTEAEAQIKSDFLITEEIFEFEDSSTEKTFDAAFEGDPDIDCISDLLAYKEGDMIETYFDLELSEIAYISWLEEKLIGEINLNSLL